MHALERREHPVVAPVDALRPAHHHVHAHRTAEVAVHGREGISIATAVRRAVAETGNAVVIGGLVLAVGFACVTASSVPSLAGFGVLACAAVAAATVAELVFLPALLVVTDEIVRRRRPLFRDGIFGAAPAGQQVDVGLSSSPVTA